MIIYGWGEKTLKTDESRQYHCPNCNTKNVTFHFFKKYAHIFWIPLFPYGTRKVAACHNCETVYEDGAIPPALQMDLASAKSMTRTPFYLYSGAILITGFVAYMTFFVDGRTKYHYPSGNKQAMGDMDGELMVGKWDFWYENGNKESEQFYDDNGREDSVWSWWDEDGNLEKTGSYKNGLYHGPWKFYFANGNLSEEENYVENREEGTVRGWYESGQQSVEGEYEHGQPAGNWIFWYENGAVRDSGRLDVAERTGIWKHYFDNGQLLSVIDYSGENKSIISCWEENGEQIVTDGNGYFKGYNENTGLLELEGDVLNGKPTGKWKSYFTNQQLRNITEFKGDIEYILFSYDTVGTAMVTNGKGYQLDWFTDGVVAAEGDILNGLKDGAWITNYQSGVQESRITYKDGVEHGQVQYFFESGNSMITGEFNKGERHGTWIYYFDTGGKDSEVKFDNGKKEGEQLFWSETGHLIKKEFYKNGELIREEVL